MRTTASAGALILTLAIAACGTVDDGTRQAQEACALAAADLAMADEPENLTPAQVAEDKSKADRVQGLAASAAKRNQDYKQLSLAATEAARWYADLQGRLAVNLAPAAFGQVPTYLPLTEWQPDTLEGFDVDAQSLDELDAECQIVSAE
ncbi:hypothetical protein JN535_03995 [Cellulosimicrobium cellulans]|uniref:hypothetical protein n=1 Tax=Cellulosimicrobium cellulans TaxID=1710 RepID=UPI001963F286|nr:hypothetical protein [Cellulosimicrobium cellulans]MBN0039335.1 hypothetical protein [Cellulosimicrobium cellulans]